MTLETHQFISAHANDDVQKLALQAHLYPNINMSFVLPLEQSSSESTALYKASLFKGNSFVDLTGGFGIDCFFISHNFKEAIYVEQNNELSELAKQNFKTLFANNIKVVNADCKDYISSITSGTDVIYIDPARRNYSGNKVFRLSECEPNVVELTEELLQKANNVLIKTSPMLDISSAIKELPATREVHVISVDNECKEILLVLNKKNENSILIKTINIKNINTQLFEYNQFEENNASIKYSSELKSYLYEPNSSIMKSGAFKLIAQKFNLLKLEKNTHLYTSDEMINDFPGRIFQIISMSGSTKQDFRQLKLKISKANITLRNYPLTVDDFRKKSGITDGGDIYIFACKIVDDFNAIIICSKKQ